VLVAPTQPFLKAIGVTSKAGPPGLPQTVHQNGANIVRFTGLGPGLLAIGALLTVTVPASASLTTNGLNVNGLTLNGLMSNSLTFNALGANALIGNGLANNGLITNALVSNGLSTNALLSNALTNNGLSINSITHNSLTLNAITLNAIAATGSALGELNGIAVEAVVLPDQPSR
jgi:hypothetical protein